LDLPVPDPLARGTDPDPSIIKKKKNVISSGFDFFMTFTLKNDVNVPSKSKKQKYLEKKIIGILKITDEKSRIR
jgi:hypothetical protein